MRQQDAPDVGNQYSKARFIQAVYGVILSMAGLALLVWLPSEKEYLRLTIGFLVVLLGGMMISPQVVKDWFSLFGSLFPFGGKKGDP